MQFIYVLKPSRAVMLSAGPTESESEAVGAHVVHLEQQTAAGTVLMAGRTQTADEHTFGLVLLECEDESAARLLMEQDPAVSSGVMTATLFPYQIAFVSESILGSA